jgi:hypothetical protein
LPAVPLALPVFVSTVNGSGQRITLRCSRCRQVFKMEVAATPQLPGPPYSGSQHESPRTTVGEMPPGTVALPDMPYRREALRAMDAVPPQVALIDGFARLA